MKRIKDLKVSEFPGVNSEKFDVWKQVEVSTHKKTNILWIISPIVIIILGIISIGKGAVFGFALSFFLA